jgi:hypothetical protein
MGLRAEREADVTGRRPTMSVRARKDAALRYARQEAARNQDRKEARALLRQERMVADVARLEETLRARGRT